MLTIFCNFAIINNKNLKKETYPKIWVLKLPSDKIEYLFSVVDAALAEYIESFVWVRNE